MPREVSIQVPPDFIDDAHFIQKRIAKKLGISALRIQHVQLLRRSIDARKKSPVFVLRMAAWVDEKPMEPLANEFPLQNVSQAQEVHIVGMGPAGLFAALECIRHGYKPVIIERGKAVRDRRRDLAKLNREGIVHPDSNYCFGEGGAGTFSDGKLYTRSTKRGDTRAVLETLVAFGATEDILIDTHPHIGTNKLPKIIQAMREAILESGGEVLFEHRLTGLNISARKLVGIELNGNTFLKTNQLILATGHSARDVFDLLVRNDVRIEAKPFAMGLRVEHPQAVIDRIQYRQSPRHEQLPAASYNLVQQVREKGVYSFCMCPGGIICPAATSDREIVVNGWSPSKRNSPFANSGIVVEVGLIDIGGASENPLAGVEFQKRIEQKAFEAGGGKQVAPAQRLTDFVAGRKSSRSLPSCSYLPGIAAAPLNEVLPKFIFERLQGGFRAFGNRMKGYLTDEAIVVGVESRTSSPVRIPRDKESCMHPEVQGLYPCGEGAGYAGGIMSAAIDGIRCVKRLIGKQ